MGIKIQKNKDCPYPVAQKVRSIELRAIEERFDFQIGEGGKIERVSLGEFDLAKEVNSHNDEVGLINCLRLAEARGIPVSTFAKTEPGLMADVDDIETLDDLLKAKAGADAKLAALAAEYGLTSDQLIAALQAGKIGEIKKPEADPVPGGDQ